MPDAKKYIAERGMRDHLGGSIRQIWDFAVNGGAIGVANLDVLLPNGAIITNGVIHVISAVTTSTGGTLSFGLNTNVDLLPATAVSNLTTDAVISILPGTVNAASASTTEPLVRTPVRLTAERELKAAVATGALTGGKVSIYLEYVGSSINVEPVTYRKS